MAPLGETYHCAAITIPKGSFLSTAYYIVVTIHVLAALLWLGGMFFLGLVGAPVLRRIEPPELRQQLFHTLGLRFRTVGWWAITVLIVTGVAVLHFRGLLQWDVVLGNPAFWATPLGIALAVKLFAVTVILSLSAIHDFSMGPAAGRARSGSPEAQRLRQRAAMLARVNGMLALVLVIAGSSTRARRLIACTPSFDASSRPALRSC